MRIRSDVRRLFRLGLRRPELARGEVDDEITFHIDARIEQLVALGLSRDEARAEAMRRFGDVAQARASIGASAARRAARLAFRDRVAALGDDLRYVVRSLASSRAFTLTVVATFALAIGANAAMFGIIDRLLVRGPEHIVAPERVKRLYISLSDEIHGQETAPSFGYVSYAFLRDQSRTLDGAAAYTHGYEYTLGSGPDAQRIKVAHVSWDLFPLLGVGPQLGRFFSAQEDHPPDGQRVLVLDESYWKRRFGGDRAVLGHTVLLDGQAYTIVGVAPSGFTGVELRRTDAWAPISLLHPAKDWPTAWNVEYLQVIARLKPGITPEVASAEATLLHRANYTGKSRIMPSAQLAFRPISSGRSGKESLEASVSRWLTGVSIIVLVIACANITNLLLARSTRRRREIAVRIAMGITRARLMRLLLTESILLALLGSACGLALAYWGGALIRTMLLPNVDWPSSPVNGRVLLVALSLATVTGVVVGAVPALQTRRLDLTGSLKSGSHQAGTQRSRLRSWLVFAQSALSVILLIGAGLFVRSLLKVRSIDLGFRPDRVLSAQIAWLRMVNPTPEESERERTRRRGVYIRALDRLRATPGVHAAALAVGTPFGNSFSPDVWVPGYDSIPDLGGGGPYVSAVTDGYLDATEIRLLEGRAFTPGDRAGSERVTIVNEPMATALWPGQSPLGKCLQVFTKTLPCARVVGVVGQVRRFALREKPAIQLYVPFGQETGIGGTVLLVRTSGDPTDFIPLLRRVLRDVDPNVPYTFVNTMQEDIDPLVRPWRMGAILFGILGGLALAIAAIGLYSVIAYMVAQRMQEFGVRLALGATTRRILSLVISRGMFVVLTGLVVGQFVALLSANYLTPLLFETSTRDPLTFGAAALMLVTVAILACLLPAFRATRVDPVIALRAD